MRKIAILTAALVSLAALPAQATNVIKKVPKKSAAMMAPSSDGILVCGLWIVPAHCSTQDRVIGSILDGAAIGISAGYIAAWTGASIAGGATVAETVQNGALIGTGVGIIGGAAALATH